MNILKLFSLFLLFLTTHAYSQSTIKHSVSKGESIFTISKKYNVKDAEIYELNPEIQGKYLQLNTILLIPNKNFEDAVPKTHKVASGETLNLIAKKYNLKLSKLIELNPEVDSRRLKIGAILKLSTSENKEEIIAVENKHTVIYGETLGGIAQKHKISLKTLLNLNPDVDANKIKVGTVLKLDNVNNLIENNPTESQTISTTNNTSEIFELKTHKIKKGETLKLIAKKYKISLQYLNELNPKINPRKLKIGTVIKLNKPELISENSIKKDSSNTVFIDETKDLIHKVLANETKFGIAKKYGITIEKIDELNPEVINNLPTDYSLIIKKGTYNASLTPEVIEKMKFDETTSMKIEILIDVATKKIGTPYRSGGTSKKGFDCSGLMFTTFKEINMNLPRSSRSMANIGLKISKDEAKIGDLIFFATTRKRTISHVGMITEIIGDEIKFIHSSTSLGVIISSVREPYYSKRFVQINRVL